MYYPLPDGFTLFKDISDQEYLFIQEKIKENDLSSYLLDKKDFLVIKNKEGNIVCFGRLYSIGENSKEISALWVYPGCRGQKLGLSLSEQLLIDKKGDNGAYLATKRSLGSYYELIGFEIITENFPEKLIHTGIWAKENGIDFIIMKYKNSL